MTTTQTAGQAFTATLRTVKGIGPRSTWRTQSHADVFETLTNNVYYPGYYSTETAAALAPGFAIASGWDKHIEGYRAAPEVIAALKALSPYRLCAFLGQLVDAGITNVGEMETWLRAHGREYATAA